MKYLAVDYGRKRTGIAVSDEGGRMAFARTVIVMTARARFWTEFMLLLAKEAPQAVVVGLPLLADGGDSLVTRQVRNFVRSLRRRSSLPVFFMPETLSSHEAKTLLAETGQKRGPVDHVAAARILESFLSLSPEARLSA
jgi:putative Holliday junction resolvase